LLHCVAARDAVLRFICSNCVFAVGVVCEGKRPAVRGSRRRRVGHTRRVSAFHADHVRVGLVAASGTVRRTCHGEAQQVALSWPLHAGTSRARDLVQPHELHFSVPRRSWTCSFRHHGQRRPRRAVEQVQLPPLRPCVAQPHLRDAVVRRPPIGLPQRALIN
jgi:hypothetical protein